jgi:hypothetical protein
MNDENTGEVRVMEKNNFLKDRKKPTETDVALAIAYYPMLVEISARQEKITFDQFVQNAKARYPKDQAIQNAIPVSTGRRFEFVRIFTELNGFPDLSAWVVNKAGKNSAAYSADYDPDVERENSADTDWSLYQSEWDAHVAELKKLAVKLKRRKPDEARKLMADFARKMRSKIEASVPNKKKLPYSRLIKPYQPRLMESLMEGLDIEQVFNDIIFEPIDD